jgi:membrane fusion protein, copper/silver efflux system
MSTPEPSQERTAPEPEENPPRGARVMAAVRWGLVALSAAAAVWAWSSYANGRRAHDTPVAATPASTQRYQCPMHPQMTSDEPGECPICQMQMRPIAAVPSLAAPLVAGATPPGTTPITLALDRVQSMGVRTSLAEERDAGGTLRVTAVLAAPERGTSEVHVRTAGFVDWIRVRETGVRVGAGQELFGLYSPEVFQAESELLAAKSFGEQGIRSVEAARQKLSLMGMPSGAIESVLSSGQPMRVIPVSAASGGYVTKKNIVLGSYVTSETALYEIVDLSRIDIIAEVFPGDAASIQVGTEGRFTLASEPAKTVAAKVDLVYPQIDADARTTRVRLQLPNDTLKLRPGQYGQVEFALAARKGAFVPQDAVVDTGLSTYVFVDEGGGRFSPRAVTVGREVGDQIELLAGLSAGERVVSSTTFLIDSESRLQASLGQTSAGKGAVAMPRP